VSNNKFPKSERLCSNKIIQELFMQRKDSENKSSSFLFPFKIAAIIPPKTTQELAITDIKYPQVVISVSKKNFKRAVDRNRIKRQIREIYRLSKTTLFANLPQSKIPTAFAIVFVAKEHQLYEFMAKRFEKAAKMLLSDK
jgi:ribonuclease P protein component